MPIYQTVDTLRLYLFYRKLISQKDQTMKSTVGQTPQTKKVGCYSFNTEHQLGKGAQGAVLKGLNTQTD